MKKLVAILMIFLLMLSLTACGKSEEAQAVDDMIADLGKITLESEEEIEEAEEALAALEERDLKHLENAADLEEAREKYNGLLVEQVEELIDEIGEVTLDSRDAIDEAREALEGLPEELQEEVSNADEIEAAEEALLEAEAQIVEDKIAAIGVVGLDSADLIAAARLAYDEADADVQAVVENYVELEAAEEAYPQLRADNVTALIDAIGEVTLQSQSAIVEAREAYDQLTADEKALVSNAAALDEAEAAFEQVRAAAAETALNNLTVEEDRVRGNTFYYSKQRPQYINERSYLIPYLGRNSNNVWVRFFANYFGDDWVFFEQLIFLIDGENEYRYYDYFDVVRDNQSGDVWEYIDAPASDSDIELLWKIANSSETIVRFQGDEYYYDYTVSAADKTGIKEILTAYAALSE